MQLLCAFAHFVFIRGIQTAILSVTERQNHPYSFAKVFQIKNRSKGYVTYILFASNSTAMWLDLIIMKEFLTTNI